MRDRLRSPGNHPLGLGGCIPPPGCGPLQEPRQLEKGEIAWISLLCGLVEILVWSCMNKFLDVAFVVLELLRISYQVGKSGYALELNRNCNAIR